MFQSIVWWEGEGKAGQRSRCGAAQHLHRRLQQDARTPMLSWLPPAVTVTHTDWAAVFYSYSRHHEPGAGHSSTASSCGALTGQITCSPQQTLLRVQSVRGKDRASLPEETMLKLQTGLDPSLRSKHKLVISLSWRHRHWDSDIIPAKPQLHRDLSIKLQVRTLYTLTVLQRTQK